MNKTTLVFFGMVSLLVYIYIVILFTFLFYYRSDPKAQGRSVGVGFSKELWQYDSFS
jgi:hypothetical protein